MEASEEQIDVELPFAARAAVSSGGPASEALPLPPGPAPHHLSPPELTARPARSRPTNNQLLYKAYFRWGHYQFKLQPGLVLPDETEACASVTSAFLQVLNTLFFVEARRIEAPRNVLHLLSLNTRRTKVVELSSGTHRVPEELRRHSLSDGGTGSYSTNLDRNRYGNDDQYLSTVIRYDLEFLDLCPCMVDVEIIDAKNGQGSILVSADPEMCNCRAASSGALLGGPHHSHAFNAGRQVQHTTTGMPGQLLSHSGGSTHSANSGGSLPSVQLPAQAAAWQSASGSNAQPKQTAGGGNRELFTALLKIAATDRPAATGGSSSSLAAAAGSGGGVTRPHSLPQHQTGAQDQRGSQSQAPSGSVRVADARAACGSARSPSGGSPGTAEGSREQTDPGGQWQNGHPVTTHPVRNGSKEAPGGSQNNVAAVAAVLPAGHSRDQELRRLQDDFRDLKEESRLLEAQLAAVRHREAAALAAAVQARTEARQAREEAMSLRTELERRRDVAQHGSEPGVTVRIALQPQGKDDDVCGVKTAAQPSPGASLVQVAAVSPSKRKADCANKRIADFKRQSSNALVHSMPPAQPTAQGC